MISVLLLVILGGIVAAGLIALSAALLPRYAASALKLDAAARCLMCGSAEIENVGPPDYACGSCGFDTRRVQGLSSELSALRDLMHARSELELAASHLQMASETGLIAEPDASLLRDHAITAFQHLRDHSREFGELIEHSVFSDDRPAPHASVGEFQSAIEAIDAAAREIREAVAVHMTADGSVSPAQLDFEHVVESDYKS